MKAQVLLVSWVIVLAGVVCATRIYPQSPQSAAIASGTPPGASAGTKMTSADDVKLVAAGLSDQVNATSIRQTATKDFDVTPTGLIALKKAGVSDALLTVIQEKGTPPQVASAGEAKSATECDLGIADLGRDLAPGKEVGFRVKCDPDQRAQQLLADMTLDEKLQLVHGGLTLEQPLGPRNVLGWVPGIARLNIPALYFSDGPSGVATATVGPATALPSSIACAASWDLDLAYRYGEVIGQQLRDYGINVWLGGNVNLTAREPRNGRTFETKGEDPLLAGKTVAAHLRAVQDQNLIACIKHFALNDQETSRTTANGVIEERAARESDLLAFEIGIKESGCQSVMAAYNLVNGVYASQNDSLLNGILKRDWGFPGFVIPDWYATRSSVSSAMAGLDQEQPGGYLFEGVWDESLKDALLKGQMPLSRLDDMVHRILRAMFAVGIFDQPEKIQPLDADSGAAVAQAVEEQGAVLLKNTAAQLPLDASKIASIAVIGSHADMGVLSGGGSAQVIPMGKPALVLPPACPPYTPGLGGQACLKASQIWDPSSPLHAIRAQAPGANVQYLDGTDPDAAAALARASEVAIVFLTEWESEGMELESLNFSDNQDALVDAVAAANSHTIVVMETGGPQIMPWLENVSAVLAAWYPGQRGGEAIANLLFGNVNPSGKLPITFPGNVQDLPRPTIPIPDPPDSTAPFDVVYFEGMNVGYKWYDARNLKPLFPFGFGLSYTSFSISNLELVPNPASAAFQVSCDVTNMGGRTGAETVQVYLGLPPQTGEPPKRLVGWEKVFLTAQQHQHITIAVEARSSSHPFSYWNVSSHSWENAPGDYTVYVGNSSRNLSVAGTFQLSQELLPRPSPWRPNPPKRRPL